MTPGPWYVCPVSQVWVEICDAPPDSNRGVLAIVRPAEGDSEAYGRYLTRDANARAIAGLPGLLEAVDAALRRYNARPRVRIYGAMQTLKAAVQACKGEKP